MSFHSLIDGEHPKPPSRHGKHSLERPRHDSSRPTHGDKPQKTPRGKRGCEFCPLNKVHGIHKIFGKVRGRKIFIWAQSPGMQENKKRKELIGRSGEWLWYELKRVRITRKMCDIQNVVRCVPADRQEETWPPLKMRTPNKEEIKCCSIYNEKALEKSKAKLHLVFGAIAHKSLLGTEYKKDKRIFWSEKLKGWVVCLDHPSYFIRQGYSAGDGKAPSTSLKKFREDLRRGAKLLKKKGHDQFEFLRSLNTIGITTRKMARWAYGKINRATAKGIRIIADMEEGDVDGKRVALCCGFSFRTDTSYTFALDMPNTGISKEARKLNHKLVKKILRNPAIKKGMHYGVSDCNAVERLLHVKVKGYDYDTQIGEFFYDPNAKKYGLEAVAERKFPDFTGYKDIRAPESFTPEFRKKIEKNKKLTLSAAMQLASKTGQFNLAQLPWPKMVMYNGADCILEKRSEKSTLPHVNPELMRVYLDASFVLYKMEREEKCKPLFDYRWYNKLEKLFPIKQKILERKVKQLAGTRHIYLENKKGERIRKRFKPSSNDHIKWLLYEKMKLPIIGEKKDKDGNIKANTQAKTLGVLGVRYKDALTVVEYRKINKIQSTYMKGFRKCADLNNGHLRTNWKELGTSTGRLSSGATKDKSNEAVINFQNIHGDPLLKCLLISDKIWYEIYEYWIEHGAYDQQTWDMWEDAYILLAFDFSQMELRVLAQKSGDKNLIKLFSSGEDPHVLVGHALTGWDKEKIAHDERVRRFVKNMQFGIVFGLQPQGLYEFLLARGVDTTLDEVKRYHAKYFRTFPGVKRMQDNDRRFVEEHGYAESLLGFRRKLNVEEQKEQGGEHEGAYWGNQAINTPVQSTAHNLMMVAVASLERSPDKYSKLDASQLEIHDAMYFRLKLKHMLKAMVQGKMLFEEEPLKAAREDFRLKWDVPLLVKPKAGFRFGVMVEDGLDTPWNFLNAWCEENKALQKDYKKQLSELN